MAIDLFTEFSTDLAAEQNGVWEDYAEGVSFLIARANNKKYSRMITKAFEKHRRLMEAKNDASEAKAEELIIDVMANTILLGWKGVVFKGATLEYSVENARTMLALKDFRRWVAEKSEDIDRFKSAQADKDLGE